MVVIVDFVGDSVVLCIVILMVCFDFECSGLFKLVDMIGVVFDENLLVNYGDWKSRGVDVLVVGSIGCSLDGWMEVCFWFYDM